MTHTLNQIMLLMETTLSAAYDAFAAMIIYMLANGAGDIFRSIFGICFLLDSFK